MIRRILSLGRDGINFSPGRSGPGRTYQGEPVGSFSYETTSDGRSLVYTVNSAVDARRLTCQTL